MSTFLIRSVTSPSSSYPIVLARLGGPRSRSNPHLKLCKGWESNQRPHGQKSYTLSWKIQKDVKIPQVENFSSRMDQTKGKRIQTASIIIRSKISYPSFKKTRIPIFKVGECYVLEKSCTILHLL